MARRITIKAEAVPFDYKWPGRTAITAFTQAGTFLVKDEVAEWAIANGKATDSAPKKAPSAKARKSAKKAPHAAPTDTGSDDLLDAADLAADDRAGAGSAVDPNAGER